MKMIPSSLIQIPSLASFNTHFISLIGMDSCSLKFCYALSSISSWKSSIIGSKWFSTAAEILKNRLLFYGSVWEGNWDIKVDYYLQLQKEFLRWSLLSVSENLPSTVWMHWTVIQGEMVNITGGLLQTDLAFDGINCYSKFRTIHCRLPAHGNTIINFQIISI